MDQRKQMFRNIMKFSNSNESWIKYAVNNSIESVLCGDDITEIPCFACKKLLNSMKHQICKYCENPNCGSCISFKVKFTTVEEKQKICYSCVTKLYSKVDDQKADEELSETTLNRRSNQERPKIKPFRSYNSSSEKSISAPNISSFPSKTTKIIPSNDIENLNQSKLNIQRNIPTKLVDEQKIVVESKSKTDEKLENYSDVESDDVESDVDFEITENALPKVENISTQSTFETNREVQVQNNSKETNLNEYTSLWQYRNRQVLLWVLIVFVLSTITVTIALYLPDKPRRHFPRTNLNDNLISSIEIVENPATVKIETPTVNIETTSFQNAVNSDTISNVNIAPLNEKFIPSFAIRIIVKEKVNSQLDILSLVNERTQLVVSRTRNIWNNTQNVRDEVTKLIVKVFKGIFSKK